jgi:hypothetical protein
MGYNTVFESGFMIIIKHLEGIQKEIKHFNFQ